MAQQELQQLTGQLLLQGLAFGAGGTLLFEELGSNVAFATALGADSNALEGSDIVAESRILSQRLAGVPMEANGILAIPQADGTLTWSTEVELPGPVMMHDFVITATKFPRLVYLDTALGSLTISSQGAATPGL